VKSFEAAHRSTMGGFFVACHDVPRHPGTVGKPEKSAQLFIEIPGRPIEKEILSDSFYVKVILKKGGTHG